MSSILVLPGGRKLDVDRIFADGGKLPVMGMMGGQRTVFETGTPPKPTIYQKGAAFFTLDGKPITEAVAKPWLEDPDLPESLKALFRKFLEGVKRGKPVKEKLEAIRKAKAGKRQQRFVRPEDAGLSSRNAERV